MLAQIDAVIVSCSCYAPNPSMAAMLVNRFGFRKDVLTFNLSGMGCSTSVVCVDMAKRLFKVWRHSSVPVCWESHRVLMTLAQKQWNSSSWSVHESSVIPES